VLLGDYDFVSEFDELELEPEPEVVVLVVV
jgi:hypothetical protein